MSAIPDPRLARARACAASVPDPEIPVVTLEDLGILREVRDEGGRRRRQGRIAGVADSVQDVADKPVTADPLDGAF